LAPLFRRPGLAPGRPRRGRRRAILPGRREHAPGGDAAARRGADRASRSRRPATPLRDPGGRGERGPRAFSGQGVAPLRPPPGRGVGPPGRRGGGGGGISPPRARLIVARLRAAGERARLSGGEPAHARAGRLGRGAPVTLLGGGGGVAGAVLPRLDSGGAEVA